MVGGHRPSAAAGGRSWHHDPFARAGEALVGRQDEHSAHEQFRGMEDGDSHARLGLG